MKFVLIIILSACMSLSIAAQSLYTVSGRVMDQSGQSLAFATVMVSPLQKVVVSDQTGNYVFENIPSGNYVLEVQYLGFDKYSRQIEVINSSLEGIDFRMNPSAANLGEVVVLGETGKKALERSAQVVTIVETEKAKLRSTDLAEVLSQTEGISVRRAGGLGSNMRFSLNGLTDDQVRFFVDDIPLEYSPYSLGLANIPVNLINRLEIYKGVLPVKLGADALGGGVNVISNPINQGLEMDFSYQVGSFNTHRATMSAAYRKAEKFVQINSFYDFSANDYKVDVQVANEQGRLEDVRVRRFHDDYSAYGGNLTFGIKDRGNTDEMSLTVYYNDLFKEVQHNNVMSGAPYGEVFRKSKGLGLIGKYHLRPSTNLEIRNIVGFAKNQREFTDISPYVYNWHGEQVLKRNNPNASEIANSAKSRLLLWDNNIYMRQITSFRINPVSKLSLSISPTFNFRTGEEKFSGTFDPSTTDSRLLTWVNSLEYQIQKGKWENSFFVKYYLQYGNAEEPLPADLGTNSVSRMDNRYGAGNVFIYIVNEQLWIKPSYEYAIRLPRPDEVFGDGAFVADNLNLKPENSHNLNLQLNYQPFRSVSNFSMQSNLFGRFINDLILLIPNNDRSSVFENVFSANSVGIEVAAKASLFQDNLTLAANATLQHFYNSSDEGIFSRFRGDRIPNRPYYFTNGSASYNFKNLFTKTDNLSAFWQLRYIHSYFLSWESLGSIASKNVIPDQTLQNAGLSYRWTVHGKMINLSLELQNLTNQKAYDFFGVQRPGRAFFMKIIARY